MQNLSRHQDRHFSACLSRVADHDEDARYRRKEAPMRGEPKSRSRRQARRSICALAFVALAPACSGSSPAAGTRPETGGNGGRVGNGNGGTTGGATGSGGSSTGTGGTLADAGSADALPPFDGGVCVDNASQQADPNMTAAYGT